MPDMPPTPSHQTVRLSRGRHRSSSAGVCVMELASMLADEPFSDRSKSMSPCVGAFLRTYNDGLDDERRQDEAREDGADGGEGPLGRRCRRVEGDRIPVTARIFAGGRVGLLVAGHRISRAAAAPTPAGRPRTTVSTATTPTGSVIRPCTRRNPVR